MHKQHASDPAHESMHAVKVLSWAVVILESVMSWSLTVSENSKWPCLR